MKPIIICGFPGIGKATVASREDIKCSNLHATDFNKANFPQNYINYIKNLYENSDFEYIFVSTRIEVIEALKKENLPFYCVIPSRNRKLEFMRLYKARRNDKKFIEKLYNNWENYLNVIYNSITYSEQMFNADNLYILTRGEFLSDLLGLK